MSLVGTDVCAKETLSSQKFDSTLHVAVHITYKFKLSRILIFEMNSMIGFSAFMKFDFYFYFTSTGGGGVFRQDNNA